MKPHVGVVGDWVRFEATLTVVRPYGSAVSARMVEHEAEDSHGRRVRWWGRAPAGEVGDLGRVGGKVTAHLSEFGRPLTKLASADWREPLPAPVAFEAVLTRLLPPASPTPPPDDRAWTKRFSKLDFED